MFISLVVFAVAATCWIAPVDAAVVDPFREPACTWCPGNRGLEYDTPAGVPVRAVASGVVTFRGSVAGVGYLVVRHADGLRVTYGRIDPIEIARGAAVVAGMIIGHTTGRLHLGVRDGDRYLDPAPFIGRLVHRIRLVPSDGSPARPTPPPRWSCPSGARGSPALTR